MLQLHIISSLSTLLPFTSPSPLSRLLLTANMDRTTQNTSDPSDESSRPTGTDSTPLRPSLPSINNLVLLAEVAETRRRRRRSYNKLPPLRPANTIQINNENTAVYFDGLPLRTYWIEGTPFTMVQPENETLAVHRRKTIDGKLLTYHLSVVQQPARARACGSGPRCEPSSTPSILCLMTC
jgi:hypothetical protein